MGPMFLHVRGVESRSTELVANRNQGGLLMERPASRDAGVKAGVDLTSIYSR